MALTKKLAQASFSFYRMVGSYAVQFEWEEDASLEKQTGFSVFVWYFQEFCVFSTIPIFALNILQKWDTYLASGNTSQLMIHIFFLLIYPMCFTFQFIFFHHGQEIVNLVNQTIALATHFQNRYLPAEQQFKTNTKNRHLTVTILFISYIAQMVTVNIPLFLKDFQEGRYLSSYVLNPYYERNGTRTAALVVGATFEFWFLTTLWAGFTLQVYINLLYLQTVSTCMIGLRSILESAPGKAKEQDLKKILSAYTQLQLLSSMYNETIGRYFLSRFNSTTAITTVSSAFLFVKLFGLKDVFISSLTIGLGLLSLCTFSGMSIYCSRVHEESKQLLSQLRLRKMPGTVISRELKCYRVIGVRIGSFFLVKRATPLTMLAMISNTTMTMLISVNFSF